VWRARAGHAGLAAKVPGASAGGMVAGRQQGRA
jgi:hypothetical protein